MRERLLNRNKGPHSLLIGKEDEDKEQNEQQNQQQNVLQNEEQNVKQNIEQNQMENTNVDQNSNQNTVFQPIKKRKPPSKKEAEKEKFINKYHPVTFYVRPDLLERFNKISGGIRGQKTKMINEALEEYLNTFEE